MKKKLKRIFAVVCAVAAAFLIFLLLGISDELTVKNYTVETEKLNGSIRIALVTDLHSCGYGEKMELLTDEIDRQKPDVILLGGDIFDHRIPDGNSEIFLENISNRYPVYYVTGNHEFWSGEEAFNKKMAILERNNVIRLSGETAEFSVGGATINICGVDDPCAESYTNGAVKSFEEQIEDVSRSAENGKFTLLLSHRPERMPLYSQYDFDLVLSGHNHGGQWRIPGLVNGVYAPMGQGFFPKYAGGEYEENGTKMIISRGLAKETTRIPRIYNKPELVIIDLMQKG